jgi:hypothetical protein
MFFLFTDCVKRKTEKILFYKPKASDKIQFPKNYLITWSLINPLDQIMHFLRNSCKFNLCRYFGVKWGLLTLSKITSLKPIKLIENKRLVTLLKIPRHFGVKPMALPMNPHGLWGDP